MSLCRAEPVDAGLIDADADRPGSWKSASWLTNVVGADFIDRRIIEPILLTYGEAHELLHNHWAEVRQLFQGMDASNRLLLDRRCAEQPGFKTLYVIGTGGHIDAIVGNIRQRLWPYMVQHWNDFPEEPRFPPRAGRSMTLRYHVSPTRFRLTCNPVYCTRCWGIGHHFNHRNICPAQRRRR